MKTQLTFGFQLHYSFNAMFASGASDHKLDKGPELAHLYRHATLKELGSWNQLIGELFFSHHQSAWKFLPDGSRWLQTGNCSANRFWQWPIGRWCRVSRWSELEDDTHQRCDKSLYHRDNYCKLNTMFKWLLPNKAIFKSDRVQCIYLQLQY